MVIKLKVIGADRAAYFILGFKMPAGRTALIGGSEFQYSALALHYLERNPNDVSRFLRLKNLLPSFLGWANIRSWLPLLSRFMGAAWKNALILFSSQPAAFHFRPSQKPRGIRTGRACTACAGFPA